MITSNCLYCNKEIEILECDYYDTNSDNYYAYIKEKRKQQSKQCRCQRLRAGDYVLMKNVLKEYVKFKIIKIDKDEEATFIIGKSEDGYFWCNTLNEIKFID